MKFRFKHLAFWLGGMMILLPACVAVPGAWAGALRITMIDGKSIEVPYYWEEGGEVKFEMPGGVAGIPKSEIASVQEIVASQAFDPEVIVEGAETSQESDQQKSLKALVTAKAPMQPVYQAVSSDEGARLLSTESAQKSGSQPSVEHVYGPAIKIEGNFAELVRIEGNGLMLVMRNVLSSRSDLKGRSLLLTLYDAEGNVLQQKPCDLKELDVDRKTMRELGLRGHLFSVMATVKPDSKVKSYEITVARR